MRIGDKKEERKERRGHEVRMEEIKIEIKEDLNDEVLHPIHLSHSLP